MDLSKHSSPIVIVKSQTALNAQVMMRMDVRQRGIKQDAVGGGSVSGHSTVTYKIHWVTDEL